MSARMSYVVAVRASPLFRSIRVFGAVMQSPSVEVRARVRGALNGEYWTFCPSISLQQRGLERAAFTHPSPVPDRPTVFDQVVTDAHCDSRHSAVSTLKSLDHAARVVIGPTS